jgi:hypothetical protein
MGMVSTVDGFGTIGPDDVAEGVDTLVEIGVE